MSVIVRRRRAIDAAVVVGVLALDLGGLVLASAGADVSAPLFGVLSAALAIPDAGVFWWRRSQPLAVFVAVVVLAVVAAESVEPGLPAQQTGLTLVLASYALGSWSMHRRWAAALPTLVVGLFVLGSLDEGEAIATSVAAPLAVIALPWALGWAARNRRLYVEQVEQRLAAAERDRDERARRAVLDERTHIARELHDVVAHHVSLIGVQAGAARTALGTSPEATAAALAAIEASSRSAVGEMRHLLDALRADDSPADVRPQPGLADLDRLADGFRAAGLRVDLTCTGTGPALPPTLDLSCYRIVEEALTNVTRHSASRSASVVVVHGAKDVRIEVTDAGPPRPTGNDRSESFARSKTRSAHTGRGLAGIRERVALFGGRLDVGPVAGGGFAVRAVLPRDGP